MRKLLTIVLAAAATSVAAADAPLEAAQRCAQVGDSLQRLMCYDRLFPPGAGASTEPVTAPPVVVTPPPRAAGSFGDELLDKSVAESKAKAGETTLNAIIQALRETRRNVYVVTLDNGQTWQQMEANAQFYLKVGDAVQIERGSMGGYRMARTSDGRSGWVRVNRVK